MSEPRPAQPGYYFFLSYAHSAPTSTHPDADADPSVAAFFTELEAAVESLARPAADMRIGFYDQQIPSGTEIKAGLSLALGAAEVFVPLYSPGYFAKSWPQREQEVFRKRLQAAGAAEPHRHIIPVLWTPLTSWEQNPDVLRVVDGEPDNADYRENGLRALRMLAPYRRSYESVLSWLAREVVTVAERFPLGPSPAPDLDDVPAPDAPEAGFLVTMLAPDRAAPEAEQAGGGARPWWKTYAGRRIPPVAERAGSVAERLGLRTRVAEFTEVEKHFDRTPAIVIVDPQTLADRGAEYLRSTFAGFPAWVVPVILDPGGPDPSRAAESVAALAGSPRTGAAKVASMDELDGLLPTLVAKARRTYLRHGQVFPPADPSPRPPRLSNPRVSDDGGPADG